MSAFTITVDCPRLYWSAGKHYECGASIELVGECDASSRWEEPDRYLVSPTPIACSHVECCDEDGVSNGGAYTPTEIKQLHRRIDREFRLHEVDACA